MIRKLLAPVVRNTPLSAPGHFVLELEAAEMAAEARPGQFIAVTDRTNTQLLRRPFSIYTADPASGVCSILFSVYGATTGAMSRMVPGEKMDIIGPLGGRVFAADGRPGAHHVMVGGGYGVPPLVFLSRRIKADHPEAKITFINGARTKAFLVGTDGLDDEGIPVLSCTDDGTCGIHGRVTVALEPILSTGEPVQVYTCGPTPMMRAVAERSIAAGVPCQVSMETFMPCGIGICMGCAVATTDGRFARGCTDGPVFPAHEVRW
ncbi:MAG: dihydroorotate dehydrogenase electron transfer subunit [Capsulimonadales bacterium]|nr:dihydroorotate dehydrogenase electron transfer subunit [Capsulimonadales bacterium]